MAPTTTVLKAEQARLDDEQKEPQGKNQMAFWSRKTGGSENPCRADPVAFDKGAKITRQADVLRRIAAKELTGSDVTIALQTALGGEVAARNPDFSPEQTLYLIYTSCNDSISAVFARKTFNTSSAPYLVKLHISVERHGDPTSILHVNVSLKEDGSFDKLNNEHPPASNPICRA